jgi:copper homeostasis protein
MSSYSGAGRSAPSSLESIAQLMALARASSAASPRAANAPLVILPGAGVNAGTIGPLLETLCPHGVREVHMSGGRWIDGGMRHRKDGMGMGVGGEGEWGIWRTEEDAVRAVRSALNAPVYSGV